LAYCGHTWYPTNNTTPLALRTAADLMEKGMNRSCLPSTLSMLSLSEIVMGEKADKTGMMKEFVFDSDT
jgi:hypothetical protein